MFASPMKFQWASDNKLKIAEILKFVLDKVENIVGKEEIVGYRQFLLFPSHSFLGS